MGKGKSGHKTKAVQHKPQPATRAAFSVGDPALVEVFAGGSAAGVTVSPESALGFPAVWRAISLVSATVAGLPLKTYREEPGGARTEVPSWVDNPCPWLPRFTFFQLVLTHMLTEGNAFLLHIFGGAGQILGVTPIYPTCVSVEWDQALNSKVFDVTVNGERRRYTSMEVTHIYGLTLTGLRGLSPIRQCRAAIGMAIAGNEASARQFANGSMIQGLVTTEEDVTEDEGKIIKADIDARISGVKNAGEIAFVNRTLKFTPWQMTTKDAQMLELKQYNVEEIARLYGVPKVLLASDGASTWGSGIAELNRGLARYVLPQYTQPIQEAFSGLLEEPDWCEFEFAGLIQATPEEEIRLLIEQVQARILTVNEARAIRNLPPLDEAEMESPDVIEVMG